ncbi:MAG: biopolymer transporter ExbD [Silicimonas sp.]|nr:biopolymer transporter ExbD [Silicimonas sp.]
MLRRERPKRVISMTSLVDVIFLLLLFFMLSSTFSKFAEVELTAASGGGLSTGEPPVFLQLYPDRVTVNGEARDLGALSFEGETDQTLLVALQPDVTAQRLTDLLVVLRRFPGLSVSVLGSG